MQIFGSTLIRMAISVLAAQTLVADCRMLHFGQCFFAANLHEIREYFAEISNAIQAVDTITDIRLLNDATFMTIPAEESCCFLNHLLRFYVENVFKHYTPTSDLIKRMTSSLANSFLSVKRDLRQCHAQRKCNCGEKSRAQINKIQNTFDELDQSAATIKAYSEVDILIRWMRRFQRN